MNLFLDEGQAQAGLVSMGLFLLIHLELEAAASRLIVSQGDPIKVFFKK